MYFVDNYLSYFFLGFLFYFSVDCVLISNCDILWSYEQFSKERIYLYILCWDLKRKGLKLVRTFKDKSVGIFGRFILLGTHTNPFFLQGSWWRLFLCWDTFVDPVVASGTGSFFFIIKDEIKLFKSKVLIINSYILLQHYWEGN